MSDVGEPVTQADRLRISTESVGASVVVHVAGEVDMTTAPTLSKALTDVVAGPDLPTRLLVDLAGVTFLSSPGLTLLVEHHRSCAERGMAFAVAAAHPAAVRTLTITGVADLVTVVPTVAEALATGTAPAER